MEKKVNGRIIKGVGGLYTVTLSDAELGTVACRARGALRREAAPLAGDRVVVSYDADKVSSNKHDDADARFVIEEIVDRKNALIRPPLANLDYIFVTMAAAHPTPILTTVDKMISIAEFNDIEPVIVITKNDLAPDEAQKIADIYRKSGFTVFIISSVKRLLLILEFLTTKSVIRFCIFAK